ADPRSHTQTGTKLPLTTHVTSYTKSDGVITGKSQENGSYLLSGSACATATIFTSPFTLTTIEQIQSSFPKVRHERLGWTPSTLTSLFYGI
ncbi:hypothetical protein M8C21_019158, partial [Ambrosia artemisiifolia]